MKHQSGNALWFILIAIVLLGLLTITLSRGSNNNDTGDYEQNQIAASEVLRYAKSIENAVQSLLARGCSENEISFENNVEAGYTNANAPADNSCHVFSSAGAGMNYIDVTKKINNGLIMSFATASLGRVLKGIGSDSRVDLFFSIRGQPPQMESFCNAVNILLGVDKTGSAPAGVFDPSTTLVFALQNTKFTGSFTSPVVTVFDIPAILGKQSFCIGHATNSTIFIHTIHAR